MIDKWETSTLVMVLALEGRYTPGLVVFSGSEVPPDVQRYKYQTFSGYMRGIHPRRYKLPP